MSITDNEARAVEFLIRNFSKDYNINQLSREIKITPAGMYKILKKLKKQDFLIEKRLGNNTFYKINYNSQDALDACRFALTGRETTPYIATWIKDLEILKKKTELAILFGSILHKGKSARDVDILLVFPEKNLRDVENLIEKINDIKSKKIHAVYQTKKDLIKNIRNCDKSILEEIRTGIILWGREILIEAIKSGKD